MSDKNMTIFLVDDDIKTLIMLKNHLERKIEGVKLNVNVFAYGENCLDKLDLKPDIVVLDYYLDNIRENAKTGSEILKAIKISSPNTKVVMMSGQEDMEIALETIRDGAYDYIIKNEKAMQRLELVVNKILIETGA